MMIDATLIARTVDDWLHWCRRHRWVVLGGVLLLIFARHWVTGANSADVRGPVQDVPPGVAKSHSQPSGGESAAISVTDASNDKQTDARLAKYRDAEIVTDSPDIDQAYLTFKPLPKDYLLSRDKAGPHDVYRECHRLFMEQMVKFPDWELLDVHPDFMTYGPRGPAFVIGIVFKTKRPGGKWIVWDRTWFFRGGKLIAEFDTTEFGKQGAMAWCFQQEKIRQIYGNEPSPPTTGGAGTPQLNPNSREESPTERGAKAVMALSDAVVSAERNMLKVAGRQ